MDSSHLGFVNELPRAIRTRSRMRQSLYTLTSIHQQAFRRSERRENLSETLASSQSSSSISSWKRSNNRSRTRDLCVASERTCLRLWRWWNCRLGAGTSSRGLSNVEQSAGLYLPVGNRQRSLARPVLGRTVRSETLALDTHPDSSGSSDRSRSLASDNRTGWPDKIRLEFQWRTNVSLDVSPS